MSADAQRLPRNEAERRVCAAIEHRRSELIDLAARLIGFDTPAREVGDRPREEAALQEHLAHRLRAVGAEVDLWEPELGAQPLVPPGLDFAGRPQLTARLAGRGGGRSLILTVISTSSPPSRARRRRAIRSRLRCGAGTSTAAARAT